MKWIVAGFFVLLGWSAAAQSAKHTATDLASADPWPIQLEEMTVPAFDIISDSATAIIAAINSIPDEPSFCKIADASKDHLPRERLLQTLSRALLIGASFMEYTADAHNLSTHAPSIK